MEKINFNKITSALKAMQEIEEDQKKFMKNMNEFDSGRSKNDPVSVWNKHKRK